MKKMARAYEFRGIGERDDNWGYFVDYEDIPSKEYDLEVDGEDLPRVREEMVGHDDDGTDKWVKVIVCCK